MLEKFYESNNVPVGDRIRLEKNILLVVPDAAFEIAPYLDVLGLSRYEVAVTSPKSTVDMTAEIFAAEAPFVLQLGCSFFRKFPSVSSVEEATQFRSRALLASADEFVSLHHHDEYSIRDGLGTVNQLIRLLKAQRRSFCCVTNHGSVGGWVRQYKACKEAGIKSIFGIEAYVSNYRGDDPEKKKDFRSDNHLILLARTKEGFDNIIRIHNDAQIDGFYYTPRTTWESCKKWGSGIIASSACMKGEIAQALINDDEDAAMRCYETYRESFDEFYIELQLIEFEGQREINRRLIQFAQKVGAPLILACDSHYLEPEQSDTHDVLMCIRQSKTLMERERGDDVWAFETKNLFYRNGKQMRQLFEKGFRDSAGGVHAPFRDDVFTEEIFRDAMFNTHGIAVGTEEIKLDSTVKLPKLYPNSEDILREKVNRGFKARGLSKKSNVQTYIDRANHEFRVINKLGWADYFLINEKIVSDAKEKFGEWVVGYGRGSAGGALVSYCLGITDVDPIERGLLFERFLDEERVDCPDIDNDFDPRYREDIKRHIVELFGESNVCSIGSYQRYRTRAVILDVARTLGYDLYEVSEVTKKIDPLRGFEDDEGEEHKVDDMTFDEIGQHYPELKAYLEKYPDVRHHAEVLRNQVKNMGTHAGGVIISDQSLVGRIPVLYDKPADREKRKIISAWAEAPGKSEELSAVGLVKFDILGLNNLPIVSDCIALIEKNRGKKLRRRDIPIDDRIAIKMGSKDDLLGIFQLENSSTKSVADEVGLESLTDVAALTSLIRPGPRDMGMDMAYARRKHGEPYEMPEFLRSLLAETHGVITFQEQCLPYDVSVLTSEGYKTIGSIVECGSSESVLCLNEKGDVVKRKIVGRHKNGVKDVYRLIFSNGFVLECTDDHLLLTRNRGWVEAQYLTPDDDVVTVDDLDDRMTRQ